MNTSTGAYAGKAPWSRLGMADATDRILSPSDFIGGPAQMGYEVEKYPALLRVDDEVSEAPNQFHLVRSSDSKVVSRSTVTNAYTVINPLQVAEVLDPFFQEGYGNMDSAFNLGGGTNEVLTFRLDFSQDIHGDDSDYDNFLVAWNSHGLGTLRLKLMRIRHCCSNVLTGGLQGADIKICHRKSAPDRLAFARNHWRNLQEHIKAQSIQLGLFAEIPCDVPNTVDELLGLQHKNPDEVTTQMRNKRDELVRAAESSPGVAGETLLDIYNGITWYTSHSQRGKAGKSLEGRMTSVLDGTRGKFEQKMFNGLVQIAERV